MPPLAPLAPPLITISLHDLFNKDHANECSYALKTLVKNPIKESFYEKRKKKQLNFLFI